MVFGASIQGVPAATPPAATPSFVGPTVAVVTTATQRITGTVGAAFFQTNAAAKEMRLDLCYESGGVLTPFSTPLAVPIHRLTNAAREPISTSATVVPGAGNWNVGLCAAHIGAGDLVTNPGSGVMGWILVTN